MFHGLSTLTLDDKGRMAIPTKYRESLMQLCEGKLVITVNVSSDHCLWLYPQSEWVKIAAKVNELPAFGKQVSRLRHLLIGHAEDLDMDGHGRLLVSPPLREFAGLDKHIALVGQGNKFEIWDKQTWDEGRRQWLAEIEREGDKLAPELASLTL
ncbi:MAG: division/cell wall cluster transcriptional repressor MraZ [Gammaproteobacteria bacterium]|nr:division/cell wall cluster transcriptional repressor MraZ [Gammaproteobacteria bacterium]